MSDPLNAIDLFAPAYKSEPLRVEKSFFEGTETTLTDVQVVVYTTLGIPMIDIELDKDGKRHVAFLIDEWREINRFVESHVARIERDIEGAHEHSNEQGD